MVRYICHDCRKQLNGFGLLDVVNEVGRKQCDLCGDNGDTLQTITEDTYRRLKHTRDNLRARR